MKTIKTMLMLFIITMLATSGFVHDVTLAYASPPAIDWVRVSELDGPFAFNPPYTVQTDSQNNIVVCGRGVTNIAKLLPDGTSLWSVTFQEGTPEGFNFWDPYAVDVDVNDNIVVVGAFIGSVDFNPDPNQQEVRTSNGGFDIFITKLDTNGNHLWT